MKWVYFIVYVDDTIVTGNYAVKQTF